MDKNGFIKYLERKDLAPITIQNQVALMERFFTKTKKEDVQITKPDILKYLEYLKNSRKQQNKTRRLHLNALKHYFTFLCQEEIIDQNPCLLLKIRGIKRKVLYKIYTPEELDVLFDNFYLLFVRNYDDSHLRHPAQRLYMALIRERNALIVSILLNQGTSTSEIEKIETGDIDLTKAILKIRGGKRSNDRTLPLKAKQIGTLMYYLQNTRPQLLEYQTAETDKLFLSLPANGKKTMDNDLAMGIFTPITAQLKTIDKQFINFQQIRASVITHWIKTQGLRKAQYLAGHKHVISTEEYLPNNLDNLTEDINKLHPF